MNIAAKYKILNKSGRNLRKIGYQLKHVNRIASTFICSLGDEKLRPCSQSKALPTHTEASQEQAMDSQQRAEITIPLLLF
ncbi:hypothetical protein P5673_012123 [Acropora cervicornis]|uniref:Uncharacterized protein n=1 Tax=Acropora cervicornis TaxID=6130 RepID=A0AAD9V7Y8_ACRCE|nr:hypothetical protein P5673_012123 [Acropora cervicornis]